MGHSESPQPVTRLGSALTDNYGNSYVAGTSIPERSDFDSLPRLKPPLFTPACAG